MLITLGKPLRKNLRPKRGRAQSKNTYKNMDKTQLWELRGHLYLENAFSCNGVKDGSAEDAVSDLSELNQLLLFWTHPEHDVSDSTHKNESTSITVASDNTATYNSRWQRRDSPVEHLFYWDSRRLGQFQRIRLQSACKGQTCWRVGITTSVTRRVPPTPSMQALHKQMPVFPQHMASIGGPPPPLPPPPPLLLCLQLRRGRRKKKQAGDSQQT